MIIDRTTRKPAPASNVRVKVKGKPIKPSVWEVFLKIVATGKPIGVCCEEAGIGHSTLRVRRATDPEFEAAFQEAYERGSDEIEEEIRLRGTKGPMKAIYYKGKKVANRRADPSDRMLELYHKFRRPEKHAQDYRVGGPDGGAVRHAHVHMTYEQLKEEAERRGLPLFIEE